MALPCEWLEERLLVSRMLRQKIRLRGERQGGGPMGKESEKVGAPRKPYAKPSVSKVELRPEEAVLGFCKTGNRSGPVQAKCNTPTRCRALGS